MEAVALMDEICMFCVKPFGEGEELVALLKPYARELLGTRPPRRSRGPRDPDGRPRWLAHVDCVRAKQKEVCMFCQAGILPGDRIAGLEEPYARALLGAEPTERSAATDPMGRPCYVAHLECATTAGADLSRAEHHGPDHG